MSEVTFETILYPFIASFLGSAILFIILSVLFRNIAKASIITSFLLILFYSFGHLYQHFPININEVVFAAIYTSIILILLWLIFKFNKVYEINLFLNIVSLVLIMIVLFNIGRVSYVTYMTKLDGISPNMIASLDMKPNELPDIYYIILDSYPSTVTLKRVLDYDNSNFIYFLKNKGFYVPTKSFSNYPSTGFSLPSALNMEYIEKIDQNAAECLHSVKDSIIQKNLESIGYTFYYFSTYNDLGMKNHTNIENKFYDFLIVLHETTLLRLYKINPLIISYYQEMRNRVLYTFDRLSKMPGINGRKFLFIHILPPHPPYIFDREGNPVKNTKSTTAKGWDEKDNYLNQLIYIEKKSMVLIEQLINKSKRKPIIILQSDHGSAFTSFRKNASKKEQQQMYFFPSDEALFEMFGNINVYYGPEEFKILLYDTITPVNTFRIVRNYLFKDDIPLLEDKYYHYHYNRPGTKSKDARLFRDVTEILINK